MSTRRATPAVLLAALALGGCGIQNPYATSRAPQTTARPGASLPPAASAVQAVQRFTHAWVNWRTSTLADRRRALARLAAGPLARELQQDATQATPGGQEPAGARSEGRYVGAIGQADGRLVVVTYERATGGGPAPQSAYQVYLARTRQTPHGWRLTQWQPATDS